MRLDQLPRSTRLEDRRRDAGGLRLPGGRGGSIGIGTIVVLGLIGWALGIDPTILIRGAGEWSRTQQPPPASERRDPSTSRAPTDQTGQLVSAVLGSSEVQWKKIFEQYGQ